MVGNPKEPGSDGRMHGLARWMVVRTTSSRALRTARAFGAAFDLRGAEAVLELGIGGGGLVALVQERYRPGSLIGTDVDARQLEEARAYLARRWGSVPSTVELRIADARELPFPSASFDVVLAMLMLHHVESSHHEFRERPRALREILRVLQPGGRFLYSEFSQRKAMRAELERLGFRTVHVRSGWRTDYVALRAPGEATVPGSSPPSGNAPSTGDPR